MASSESDLSIVEYCERIDCAAPQDRARLAGDLQRSLAEDMAKWTEVTDEAVELLAARVDDSSVGVRCVAVLVLSHVAAYDYDEITADRSALAARVLERVDDESPRVRQVVFRPRLAGHIVEATFNDEAFTPKPPAWLAVTCLDHLDDPAAVVRKRVGNLVESHGSDLVREHPDTQSAVATLAGALEDPLNAVAPDREAASPRSAALVALRSVTDDEPDLVARHIDVACTLQQDARLGIRQRAAELVLALYEADAIELEDVATQTTEAIDAHGFPLIDGYRDFAVSIALADPAKLEVVYRRLAEWVTAENTTSSWRYPIGESLAPLCRLVRESEQSFDPPIETLVELVERSDEELSGTDPLALLAPHHPDFVANELRDGYREVAVGDARPTRRFDAELVVDVADRNDRAIVGIPGELVDGLEEREILRAFVDLAAAHPDTVSGHVADAVDALEWSPPLTTTASEFVEVTTGLWDGPPIEVFRALAATVESQKDRHWKRRWRAARVLASLSEDGHDCTPDRFGPLVEAYRNGALDDEVDPLDLPAVRECVDLDKSS